MNHDSRLEETPPASTSTSPCGVFNPFSLEGKRVLVTGASSGFGHAIALSCARMGAEVIATGRNVERLGRTLEQLNEISPLAHRGVIAELTEARGREAVVEALEGDIHGLVHNAATGSLCATRQMSQQHLHALYLSNVEAPMLLTQAVLKNNRIAADGSILFISSISAYSAMAGVGGYSGTKAALIAMARCLALEVSKRRIRVNCLAPGQANTPMLEGTRRATVTVDEQLKLYPLGVGEPEDIANAAIFMLSGASRWITGTTLVLDGGLTLR